MRRLNINSGDSFNRLTVIKELPGIRQPSGQLKRYISFRCICGNEISATLDNVKSNKIKSCGCLNNENRTSHGLSSEPLAIIWYGIHDRCLNNPDYTSRNIKVSPIWLDDIGLANFIQWAKTKGNYKPGLEIDRENNNLGYYPENCRFVTRSVNQRNKRNTLLVEHPITKEKISLISLWESEGNSSLKWSTVRHRYLYLNWTVQEAINKPVRYKESNNDN